MSDDQTTTNPGTITLPNGVVVRRAQQKVDLYYCDYWLVVAASLHGGKEINDKVGRLMPTAMDAMVRCRELGLFPE